MVQALLQQVLVPSCFTFTNLKQYTLCQYFYFVFVVEARSNSIVSIRAVLLQWAEYRTQSAGRAINSANLATWQRQTNHVHQCHWCWEVSDSHNSWWRWAVQEQRQRSNDGCKLLQLWYIESQVTTLLDVTNVCVHLWFPLVILWMSVYVTLYFKHFVFLFEQKDARQFQWCH